MSASLRYIVFVLSLCLAACRQEVMTSVGPSVHLQGVYQKVADRQLAKDCSSGKLVRLQDTAGEELQHQCSLFDHPDSTDLWLDLEGRWKKTRDTVFVINRIHRIERRSRGEVCR